MLSSTPAVQQNSKTTNPQRSGTDKQGMMRAPESAVPEAEFVLGMTAEDVHKAFGIPVMYFNRATKLYFDSPVELRAAERLGREVDDVYVRRTTRNSYRCRVGYGLDGRQSRLNPIKRVKQVDFELDKPVDGVKAALSDLGVFEAARLCSRGCNIFQDLILEGFDVQPSDSSPEELEEAKLIDVEWNQSILDSKRKMGIDKEVLVQDFSFYPLEGQKIVRGQLGVLTKGNPSAPREIPEDPHMCVFRSGPAPCMIPMGTWQPSDHGK
jgi:hypothetical protein